MYYTLADIKRMGAETCLRHMNELHETNKKLTDADERAASIEQLARDLLARLSRDYGDGEDCPPEVEKLFERGEQLLPIEVYNPTFICEDCGRETPIRMNGSCVECAEKNTNA